MYRFEYVRASSVQDATSRAGEEAVFLGGGQSLLGAMRLRLAAPETLVDIGGIADLRGIDSSGDSLDIGAMTTHATVAADDTVRRQIPALADLAGGIGDRQVRNVGTIGGSIANNDPAADYPAGVLGLGATVVTDQRRIAADDFFTDMYETALQPGELITQVSFPVPEAAAYIKFKQQASRYALVGVFVAKFGDGVRVAVTGAASSVFRCEPLEKALSGDFSADAARGVTVSADELTGDIHAAADYRAHLIPVLAARAVSRAA
ncbi:MAG TPA: xanthine dehydrogenase family protein subunit M [Arenicellales bacterium]|nr:xanthine dehydrogenase family protein subunit M [Arenicellales bacterium]